MKIHSCFTLLAFVASARLPDKAVCGEDFDHTILHDPRGLLDLSWLRVDLLFSLIPYYPVRVYTDSLLQCYSLVLRISHRELRVVFLDSNKTAWA